jgi:hypothetical protein
MTARPCVGAGILSRVTDALRRIIQMPVDVSAVPGALRSLAGPTRSYQQVAVALSGKRDGDVG